MKKIILILVTIVSLTGFLNAQDTQATFAKGDNVIGAGFGIGGVYGFSSYNTQTPVFGAQYDRGIVELGMGGVIGVGGFIGYKNYVYKNNNYKDKWGITIIGARGTFHYDLFKVKNLDTYAGTMIAFHILSNTNNYPDYLDPYKRTYNNAAYASLFAGAKYYFAPKVAGYAEVGYGVAWLTMGIAFKF
jgi:hypothetical protein